MRLSNNGIILNDCESVNNHFKDKFSNMSGGLIENIYSVIKRALLNSFNHKLP